VVDSSALMDMFITSILMPHVHIHVPHMSSRHSPFLRAQLKTTSTSTSATSYDDIAASRDSRDTFSCNSDRLLKDLIFLISLFEICSNIDLPFETINTSSAKCFVHFCFHWDVRPKSPLFWKDEFLVPYRRYSS